MGKKRFVLNESDSDFEGSAIPIIVGDDGDILIPDDSVIPEIPADLTMEEPPEEDKNNAISQMLSDLIKDEWEAIDGYNSTITTLRELGGHDDIIKVLEDIATEEMVHVGELEHCLELIKPQAQQIEDGKEEAAETIKNEVTPDVTVVEENLSPLKEDVNDITFEGKGYEDYIVYWMNEALSDVEYLIEDGDDEEEDVITLRQLNDAGIEYVCSQVAESIVNSDYLWEHIHESMSDYLYEAIKNVQEHPDEYFKYEAAELNTEEAE